MEGTPLRNHTQDRFIQANGGDTPAQSDSIPIYTSEWMGHPCAIRLNTDLYKRMDGIPLRNQTQDRFIQANGRDTPAQSDSRPIYIYANGAQLILAEGRARVYTLCNTSTLQRQWSSGSSGGGRARVYISCNTSRLQMLWSSVSNSGGTSSCMYGEQCGLCEVDI